MLRFRLRLRFGLRLMLVLVEVQETNSLFKLFLRVGGLVLKMKLMLYQLSTKL